MTRNNWSFLGENFDAIRPSLKLFRTMAEHNQQRIRPRFLRALSSGGNSGSMDDIPDAQLREEDDIDEDWPVVEPSVPLCLPKEIALSLSGPNPCWESSSGKRSRENQGASSAKISKFNDQEDNVSNQGMDLDEFGLPKGDWEDRLLDITAEDLQNAADLPLAGWAP